MGEAGAGTNNVGRPEVPASLVVRPIFIIFFPLKMPCKQVPLRPFRRRLDNTLALWTSNAAPTIQHPLYINQACCRPPQLSPTYHTILSSSITFDSFVQHLVAVSYSKMSNSTPVDDVANTFNAQLTMQERDAYRPLTDERLKRVLEEREEQPGHFETLKQLRDLQKEHDEIFTEYLREKQELEDRYEGKIRPLYTTRKKHLDEHPIKLFWFKAFEHCETLRENITDKDALALKYLTDVSVETVTKQKNTNPHAPPSMPIGSFTLTFRFADNPFFENDVLTKTYIMQEDDFEELQEARGIKVLWKPGKDLTVRTMKKKTKNGRVLIRKEPTDSFFNFFSPPSQMIDGGSEVDENMLEELDDVLDADYELGDCIRSDVIPRALLYYLNIAEGSDSDSDSESSSSEQRGPTTNGRGAPDESSGGSEDESDPAEQ